MDKTIYKQVKTERREIKRTNKRHASAEEVIFIFEKILAGWKTIRIFNTIIQQNPDSQINKKKVEIISTGNCKVFESEFLTHERYLVYLELREKVYELNKFSQISTFTEDKTIS